MIHPGPSRSSAARHRYRETAVVFATVLLCSVFVAATPAQSASPTTPSRVAALDWELAQTLLALGIDPVAVAEAEGYREWVAQPPLPETTTDLGRRTEPSLTALRGAQPDLIVMSDHYGRGRARLEKIAPVLTQTMVQPDSGPLEQGRKIARTLAERLGRQTEFAALKRRLDSALDALRAQVQQQGMAGDSMYAVQFQDADHVRVFGPGSLFHAVIDRAGLENAWNGGSNAWGFALAEMTRLDRPADYTLVLEPVPHRADAMMERSAVWRALPPVRDGEVRRVAPVWAAGGLPSAIRFAKLLGQALDERD